MPPKNPPTARQWELIAALKKSKGMTLKDLAERFGVDERTIRRDLSALIKSGLPILELTEAHGRKLWYTHENPLAPAQFNFRRSGSTLSRTPLFGSAGQFLALESRPERIEKNPAATRHEVCPNPRSTLGNLSRIDDGLERLFAAVGGYFGADDGM